jgi:hypothetical protein
MDESDQSSWIVLAIVAGVVIVVASLGAMFWLGMRPVAAPPAMPIIDDPVVTVGSSKSSGPTAAGIAEPDFEASAGSGIQDLRVLSDRWVCAVLDTTAEVLAERDRRYAGAMKADRAKFDKNPQDWYYAFSKTYHTLAVWAESRPRIVRQLDSRDHWKLNGKPPDEVSYWPQSVDGFPAYDPSWPGLPDYANLPRIADFVYLKLPAALRDGDRLEAAGGDRRGTLRFYERATVCWPLKVNQVGYRPDAPAKYAYLGMWLGGAGPADFAAFKGRPFHIHAFEAGPRWCDGRAAGEPAFSGTIQLRKTAKELRHNGQPISGEDVYELDFSSFDRPGRWCIVVPGLGRSWPFRIAEDAYGEAFYTMMKGLYAQRCGCELRRPYTAWTRPACHTLTYRGGFLSEADRWYDTTTYATPGPGGKVRYGFRDEAGKPVAVSSFTVVHSTATKEVVPGVRGGWHDAADYDRRIGHYNIVWDLCGAYEMFPKKFPDGQLNMPESGNGIPDILDESAIQVDLFRATQTVAGGVSGWIEQNSHPGHDRRPDQDTNPFCMSLPDRGASFAYAAAAAYLGRLIAPFDAVRSKTYIESAQRAYAWGADPANAIKGVRFKVAPDSRDRDLVGNTLLFDEKEDLPTTHGGKAHLGMTLAAMQLYAATSDKRYRDDWDHNGGVDILIRALPDAVPSFAFVTPTVKPDLFGEETADRLKRAVLDQVSLLLEGQKELAYRNLWRPPTHGYFPLMAWGNVHSALRARFPILAWRLTGDAKYHTAALLGADWELGCNELGRAMATGLGTVRPIILQHIHSQSDGILEPVPGIAPFTLTYGIAPSAWRYQFGLIDDGHPSVKDYFKPTATCLLPAAMGRDKLQAEMDTLPREGDWARAAAEKMRPAVEGNYPIFRRTYIHPFMEPAQNEFTVSETIAPHAAVYGCLLPDGWKPGKDLADRKPITNPAGLPLYPQP